MYLGGFFFSPIYIFFDQRVKIRGIVKMKNFVNRGKFCNILGCKHRARVKGLCVDCYREDVILKKLDIGKLNI